MRAQAIPTGAIWTIQPPQLAWGGIFDPTIANPAVGKDWGITLPAGFMYWIILAQFRLEPSAQVKTRLPGMKYTDLNGVVRFRHGEPNSTPASKPGNYTFGQGLVKEGSFEGLRTTAPLPAMLVPGGWQVGSEVVNLQTEDKIIEPHIYAIQHDMVVWEPDEQEGRRDSRRR